MLKGSELLLFEFVGEDTGVWALLEAHSQNCKLTLAIKVLRITVLVDKCRPTHKQSTLQL